jgi:hypothetical protein
MVTGLGRQKIILRYTWLRETNPIIDWEKGTLEWRQSEKEKRNRASTTITEEKDEEAHLNATQNPLPDGELALLISTITDDMDNGIWINSKSTTATKIQAEINLKKKILPLEEQVPQEFHDFLDVFSEEKAARFPEP